jgi:hypothetical protein
MGSCFPEIALFKAVVLALRWLGEIARKQARPPEQDRERRDRSTAIARGASRAVHASRALAGSARWKLAPREPLSAAHKRPLWDSTMERLMDRPMPVP